MIIRKIVKCSCSIEYQVHRYRCVRSITATCRITTAAHIRANVRLLVSCISLILHLLVWLFCEWPKRGTGCHVQEEWRTWHEFGRGKDLFLYLSGFSQKFLSCHGKLQSVPDNLASSHSVFAHHRRLHVPGVPLSKAVTNFLEGHSVEPLCV